MGVRGDTRLKGGMGSGTVFTGRLVVRACERTAHTEPGGLDQLRVRVRVRGWPGGLVGKLLGSLDAVLGPRASLSAMDSANEWS